jgi:hypothetical protein
MNGKTHFILGFHCSVPYGAEEDEIEEIYGEKLRPFISTLNRFPQIPAVLHYSGTLLDWLDRRHPEFLMLIKDLLTRKQVELLGGGFYEPMMPLLSLTDKLGQIELLTTYLRKKFGHRPQGAYIPGPSWEQSLVGTIHTCGMGYTFLEESQFFSSGMAEKDLFTPWLSEFQGKLITVFPVSFPLGRKIQAEGVRQALSLPVEGGGVYPIFPYGGDVQRLFEDLDDLRMSAPERLDFMLPGRYVKSRPELRRIYFNSPAVKNFLISCPEANGIYSKMIFTHVLINNQLRGDKSRKQNARAEIWKAQGFTLFSPGEEMGIERRELRNAAWQALLEAEKISRETGEFRPSLSIFDFDLDGEKEFLFQEPDVNWYIQNQGAALFELDYLPQSWNYLDTFEDRRQSAPHFAGQTPRRPDFRRSSFMDRLLPPQTSLADLAVLAGSTSRFCGAEIYTPGNPDRRAPNSAVFRLGSRPDLPFGDIEMEKAYSLMEGALRLDYTLCNRGRAAVDFCFASQVDLAFPGEDYLEITAFKDAQAGEPYLPALQDKKEFQGLSALEFRDLRNGVRLRLAILHRDDGGGELDFGLPGGSFDAAIFPVRSPPQRRNPYQSTCSVLLFRLCLAPGETFRTAFTLEIGPLEPP